MMKRLLTLMLLTMAVITASAIPAEPGLWRTLKTATGHTLEVQLVGDEFLHYWQAKDGSWYTERHDVLYPADMQALRQNAERLRSQDSGNYGHGPQRVAGQKSVAQRVSFTGNKRCLILLVQFSDVAFTMDNPQSYYNRLANEKNLKEGRFVGSVADYFRDQSDGRFNLQFDVVGPYTLGTQATYGANDKNGSDVNARGMVTEACRKAYNDGVDFSPYDWDGDGYVEEVYVLYAGRGEATNGGANTIWPHKWQLASPLQVGSKYVSVYACSNELRTESTYMGIGTICHEFSHCLGYPDMYDIRGNSGASNTFYGMGTWDLMCSGSYNGNEFCPAGYTAYEKMVAGWITPKDLEDDATVTGMKTTVQGGDVYRFTNPGSKNEYYLIENRQQTGWDRYVGSSGIIINHIDYNAAYWSYNYVNTPKYGNDHERITIIPADNTKSGQTEYGDAWPYGGVNALGPTTTPSCVAYNDNNGLKQMNFLISNMACQGGVASFKFTNFNRGSSQEDYLLHETFSRSNGTGGNDGKGFAPPMLGGTFATGTFVSDVDGWKSNLTLKAGFQCAVVGRNAQAGTSTTLTSPVIKLAAGDVVHIKFLAAPYGKAGASLALSADNGELGKTQFDLTPGEWNTCETTLTGSGEVSLTFTGYRFFIDEIEITSQGAAGITDIVTPVPTAKHKGIYSLDGTYLGTDLDALPRGLYIVNGRKVVK